MLAHRHRLERAARSHRTRRTDFTDLGGDPLGRRTVTRVRCPTSQNRMAFITEMLSHLNLQTRLQHLTDQTRQQAILTGELHALAACPSHQQLSPVVHRRLPNSTVHRHSQHIMISHRHDPFRSTTPSRGPSDHTRYTKYLTVPRLAQPLEPHMTTYPRTLLLQRTAHSHWNQSFFATNRLVS